MIVTPAGLPVKIEKDDPQGPDLHVDALATEFSIGYSNTDFIVDQISPEVNVNKRSGKYATYDQSHWFRDEAKKRAPGTKSEGGGWSVTTSSTFYCDRYSFRHEISDEDRDMQDDPFDVDREASEFVADKIMLRREVDWATTNFTTGVFATDKTGGTDFTIFSDYGASTPLVTLTEYADTVEGDIARTPNVLVLGKQVWRNLRWHPDLIDAMKVTDVRKPTVEMFANLLDMDKVLVGKSIYTTDAKGTAEGSVTYTRVWGNNALLLYVPERPSLRTPSACYTVVWNRVPNAKMYIKRMRNEEREIDIMEGNSYFDHLVTGTSAGLFLSGAS